MLFFTQISLYGKKNKNLIIKIYLILIFIYIFIKFNYKKLYTYLKKIIRKLQIFHLKINFFPHDRIIYILQSSVHV